MAATFHNSIEDILPVVDIFKHNHKTLFPFQTQEIIPIATTRSTSAKMSTTVHVKGISGQTSEKEVRDFFSFW